MVGKPLPSQLTSEQKRFDIHLKAIATEERRAHATAGKLAKQLEAEEAIKLRDHHQKVSEYAQLLGSLRSWEKGKAELELDRLKLIQDANLPGMEPEPINHQMRYEVEVKPETLTEQRLVNTERPFPAVATFVIEEKAPQLSVDVRPVANIVQEQDTLREKPASTGKRKVKGRRGVQAGPAVPKPVERVREAGLLSKMGDFGAFLSPLSFFGLNAQPEPAVGGSADVVRPSEHE